MIGRMDKADIEAQALSLPIEARASLAHRLLQSLEMISEEEYERLWGEESARRAAEADARRSEAISGSEVARKARSLLR
jgi:hypothetical protein